MNDDEKRRIIAQLKKLQTYLHAHKGRLTKKQRMLELDVEKNRK